MEFEAATPTTWNRAGLEAAGYAGFVTFGELRRLGASTKPGVYVVLRSPSTQPTFLPVSPAGKAKSFTEDVAHLQRNWIPGAEVIYIGLATHGARRDGIHRRLKQFRRTGAGTADNHGGGVWIFQLADANDLMVCWRAADDEADAYVAALEHHLIADFAARAEQGRWPFANRKA
ncbi:hypothetical protein [Agromyces italicus]|uniref:hypothetical protein n=1 Tax=Agromyces italicus TaxID=279572 RepID=UPI0003B5384C|nr:hypothetical protein [Agromyces italicus]